jgi:biopolymer transport protein ExbB
MPAMIEPLTRNFLLLATEIGDDTGWLTSTLLEFARSGAEWVLWLLVVLSLLSVATMVERAIFYGTRKADTGKLHQVIVTGLDSGRPEEALAKLEEAGDSMEAHVIAYGFQHIARGPRAVEELMAGALARERVRYDRFLAFLATLGNNAPFIGLFGTVLGVIQAFDGLRGLDMSDASAAGSAVMGPIAEALVATGVGLVVAIPAVVAFNIYRTRVKKVTSNTELLVRTMIAYMVGDKSSESS